MTYTLLFDLNLGSAGLTDARAQLIGPTGSNVGSPISTGFVEVGSNFYQWAGVIPDGFTGGAKFYSAAAPTVILDFKAINLPVWGQPVRTLTQSVYSILAAIAGSVINIMRGDSLSLALTGLGNIAAYVSIDFTLKNETTDTDAQAVLRIRKNASNTGDGLLTLNGATAPDPTAGSLTINDGTLGNITIALDAPEAATLPINSYAYDVQLITAAGVYTLTTGTAIVRPDVTLAVT